MYFDSRVAAGKLLAKQIAEKINHDEDYVVLALNEGGVMVGGQIAIELHCALMLLLSEKIMLPREDIALAGITHDGSFAFNHRYSQGEIDELVSEYYHFIEQEKLTKMQEMERSLGRGKIIDKELLKNRNIILVTDGLNDGFALDIAVQYLKPVNTKKIIVATPIAGIYAVDYMHILADEIFCLDVIAEYMNTEHYYKEQDVPPRKAVIAAVEQIVGNWQS